MLRSAMVAGSGSGIWLLLEMPFDYTILLQNLNQGFDDQLVPRGVSVPAISLHIYPPEGFDGFDTFLDGTTGAPIPEPTTIALLGIGLAGLAGVEVRRRRKKKAVVKR